MKQMEFALAAASTDCDLVGHAMNDEGWPICGGEFRFADEDGPGDWVTGNPDLITCEDCRRLVGQ